MKKASHLGTLLWACLQCLDEEEEEKLLPLLKGGIRMCVVLEFGQHVPLAWRESAKISKLLLADLCCNTLKKVMKFLFFNRNFPHIKTRNLY
jgi:hypothetical protein